MNISQPLYERLLNDQRSTPPETGGILGGRGGIITTFQSDEGIRSDRMCSYIPDTKRLNAAIRSWQNENITLMGIYHTHFFDVETLSVGDKAYMEKIIRSMPAEIEYLYFPLIVMPKRKMVIYVAKILSGKLVVNKEDVTLIENEEMEEHIHAGY